ncbi:MAG: hypothetical protein HY613_07205 [Candidatus Rokubacteria bacterium]|nr:hypothetical protein [Candidatus Rokubacteria bacterium]
MTASWALDRHVSQTMQRLLLRRHGLLVGWPRVRWLWLSGAMDGREVPARHCSRVPRAVGLDPEARVYRMDDERRN